VAYSAFQGDGSSENGCIKAKCARFLPPGREKRRFIFPYKSQFPTNR
jgi:hypothetical protein